MKQLYIFDFDGMLVDTILDSIIFFNKALKELGLPTYSEDLTNFRHEEFGKFLKDTVGDKKEEFFTKSIEYYTNTPQINTHPYDGMEYVLEELQNRNKTLAICSNREEEDLKVISHEIFKNINFKYISGYRKDVPNKPNPYRLNEIIEMENIDRNEVIYFGDRIVDVEAASNANIDMVLVTYGQGNKEDYTSTYPIKVIDSPLEILDIKELQ